MSFFSSFRGFCRLLSSSSGAIGSFLLALEEASLVDSLGAEVPVAAPVAALVPAAVPEVVPAASLVAADLEVVVVLVLLPLTNLVADLTNASPCFSAISNSKVDGCLEPSTFAKYRHHMENHRGPLPC